MAKMNQESDEIRQQDSKQTTCWKCGLVCKSKQGLSVHQNKCLSNAVKGTSFFQYERLDLNSAPPRKPKSQSGKVIPPSQPLIDGTQEVDERPLEQGEVPVTVDKPPEENNPSEKKEGRQQTTAKANEEGITSSVSPDVQHEQQQPQVRRAEEETLQRNTVAPSEQSNDDTLKTSIMSAYEVIVKWRRNLFELPKGASGKAFVTTICNLIDAWCNKTEKREYALYGIAIMPNLLLQKTNSKRKRK